MSDDEKQLDILRDERVNCYSILVKQTVGQYLDYVQQAYQNKGGIEGQRDPLKTSTAIRIRSRMVVDLKVGAVLPPIVLGVVVSNNIFDKLESYTEDSFTSTLNQLPEDDIFIIDGMQRTTALIEVSEASNISSKIMRVEYWVAKNTNSLIYRMLILNTGQVPWNLRRQIEIVFKSMIKEMKENVDSIEVLEISDQRRRTRAGQFQADQLIELFLVFGARKEKVDTKERLADEFTRLDFIEASSEEGFTKLFYDVVKYLSLFDKQFSKYESENGETKRFENGKDLFGSQPARVGFVTAIALEVLGRPGAQVPHEGQIKGWKHLKENADKLLAKLDGLSSDEIGEFLDFHTLSELISRKSGKVGEFEREFFLKAFGVLLEEGFNLSAMTPCWRAY